MAAEQFTPGELATEEWRPVVGYEGEYDVSSLGRVKRIGGVPFRTLKPRILQARTKGNTYPAVLLLRRGRKPRNVRVHILVAEAFIGPQRSAGKEIRQCSGLCCYA